MAVFTYEDVIPAPIPNTVMRKMYINGVHKTYTVAPAGGYVLHDSAADVQGADPETGELTGQMVFCYSDGMATCGANYDFTPVQVTDENGTVYTAYGGRAFFARKETV